MFEDQKRVWNDSSPEESFQTTIKWGIKKRSVIFNMKSIFMGSTIVFCEYSQFICYAWYVLYNIYT